MPSDHFPDDLVPDRGDLPEHDALFPGEGGPSGLARLVTVVTQPRRTFDAVAARPQPWVAIVALVLVVGVGSALIAHIAQPEQMELMLHSRMGERLAENPDFLQRLEDARNPTLLKRVFAGVSGGVGMAVMLFIASFFYWIMCRVVGGQEGFIRTLDVVALGSWVGSGLGFFATVPLVLAKGSVMTVGYSLAPVLGLFGGGTDPSSVLYRILQSFTNGFAIWQLVLMAIGFSVVHRIGRGAGWAAALIPWAVGYTLSVVIASFFG